MKIFSIVGVRGSGKTTTAEALIRELKRRGFTVGTVKTINCPMFSMEEKESSNTLRHKRAGADVVCASARGETAFIYASGMEQNAVFARLCVDYLILEGDYQADVPRIVCAHTEQEVRERQNRYTFLVSGRIADEEEEVCGIRAVSAVRDAQLLADTVLREVRETPLPVPLSPIPEEANYFCRHMCKKNCGQAEEGRRPEEAGELSAEAQTAAGKRAAERKEASAGETGGTSGVRHFFLTGKKQAGKSTIWNRILQESRRACAGFRTLPFAIGGERRGFYLHALGEVPEGYSNDVPISVRTRERGSVPVTEAFDTFGAAVLRQCLLGEDGRQWILMDELGKMEAKAEDFQRAVFDCLDSGRRVLGVLQQADSPFLDAVKRRPDVAVYTVTEDNRETLYRLLRECVLRDMGESGQR